MDLKEPIEREEWDSVFNLIFPYLIGLIPENQKLIETYKEQLNNDPNNIEILNNLAAAHIQFGDYQEGYKYIERIHKLDKNNLDAILYLAEINLKVFQNPKTAIEYYTQYLKYDQNIREVWFNLGFSYESVGKYKKALNCYGKVVYLDFDSDEAWFRIALINYDAGNIMDAILYLKVALKVNPFHEEASKLLNEINSIE
jgi:tetratricopeptide (TPR) repeat protein